MKGNECVDRREREGGGKGLVFSLCLFYGFLSFKGFDLELYI